jgi:hypothetical protein
MQIAQARDSRLGNCDAVRLVMQLPTRGSFAPYHSESKTERNAAALAENSGDSSNHCPRESTSTDALGYENDSG